MVDVDLVAIKKICANYESTDVYDNKCPYETSPESEVDVFCDFSVCAKCSIFPDYLHGITSFYVAYLLTVWNTVQIKHYYG